MIQADLFVYSKHSPQGLLSPEEVYRVCKSKGMQLVTLTDQNTFRGCLDFLNKYPYRKDFIPGEEIWAYDPTFQLQVRFAVYGLNETQHKEIHRLKENITECIQYLQKEKLTYVLLHPFDLQRLPENYAPFIAHLLKWFNIFEVHHGKLFEEHNTMLAYFVKTLKNKGICGGSHARTPKFMASTFTVSKQHTVEGFFGDLKTAKAWTEGQHGTPKRSAHEFEEIYLENFRRKWHEAKFNQKIPLFLNWLAEHSKFWLWNLKTKTAYVKNQKKMTPIFSEILGSSRLNPCELPQKLIKL